MPLLNPQSLADTINNVHDAFFFARPTTAGDRKEAALWIAGRHDEPGSYANTFALLPDERKDGILLFTGERVVCAAARHITGQEACRALRLLDVKGAKVKAALDAAANSLQSCVGPADRKPAPARATGHWLGAFPGGTYCCGQCSVSVWRHILAGGWDHVEHRLTQGLRCLKTCRKPDGTWRVFPFWYTMLALAEIDLPQAAAEIRHGQARLERMARQSTTRTASAARRIEVARRALVRV